MVSCIRCTVFSLSLFSVIGFVLLVSAAKCDGPADNQDAQVRRIPPLGIELSDAIQVDLLQKIERLESTYPRASMDSKLESRPPDVQWWNDVRVLVRSVRMTLEGRQFYKESELDQARKLLSLAEERATELASGAALQPEFRPSWSKQSGRIVAGHQSNLDDTVQPFGILVPESVASDPMRPRRLDVWLHGRDESVSEVGFLYRRWTQDSPYMPEDTYVLQPWGRYSNAFRFAGETDVLEAIAEVQRRYAIDSDRICIRGFSMGGAGCWHLAVHHPDLFYAANPGAGFCETERFLTGFQNETLNPTPAQRQLWNLYDCPPVVRNLTNLPTIAYSGGIDRQKEAADIMTEAATNAGFDIPYVIHPESAHAIHPDAKREIQQKMSELATRGRAKFPKAIVWSTFSLKYPGAYWINLEGLDQHWSKATIEAAFSENLENLSIATDNVRRFEVTVPLNGLAAIQSAAAPMGRKVSVEIDNQAVGSVPGEGDGSLQVAFEKAGNSWKIASSKDVGDSRPLQKTPGLQGPIDDAFLSRFLIVRPTGISTNASLDAWAARELQHAIDHWRLQFRGDARIKADVDVTEADLQESNLICFGTPESNRWIAKLVVQTPLRWSANEIAMGSQSFDGTKVIPVCIYPNPIAPHRYVVFNSGFTYREYDYLNNARQTPKLPDWAMIDATSPPTTRAAGKVIAEGFFNEEWMPK